MSGQRQLLFAAGVMGILVCGACVTMSTSPSLQTVAYVDLERYLGRWNVIAHVPNFLEKGKVATADVYARRPDGRLSADYVFRKGDLDAPEERWEGVAWVTNPETQAEWKVQLLWPFSADYYILELDPDYQWAVVASRGGKWLWILARETTLPDSIYADLVARIRKRGLDAEALRKVPQPPSA